MVLAEGDTAVLPDTVASRCPELLPLGEVQEPSRPVQDDWEGGSNPPGASHLLPLSFRRGPKSLSCINRQTYFLEHGSYTVHSVQDCLICWTCVWLSYTALLKVDFGSRSHSRVPDFYSTFVKKSTLSRVNPTITRLHLGCRDLTRSHALGALKC